MQVVLADKAAVISGSFWGTSTPYHAAIRKAWQDATGRWPKYCAGRPEASKGAGGPGCYLPKWWQLPNAAF